MKQYKRGLIVIFLYVSLFLIIGTSCRTRQVSAQKESFSDKSQTEEQTKVKEKSQEKVKDKSKVTITQSDTSKTTEVEETEITADEIVVEKDGKTTYKGNVKVKGKKRVDSAKGSQSRLESLKDVSTDKSVSKDSTSKKSEDKDIKSGEKKKDTDVSNVSLMPFVVLVGILLLIAFVAVRWNWLRSLLGF